MTTPSGGAREGHSWGPWGGPALLSGVDARHGLAIAVSVLIGVTLAVLIRWKRWASAGHRSCLEPCLEAAASGGLRRHLPAICGGGGLEWRFATAAASCVCCGGCGCPKPACRQLLRALARCGLVPRGAVARWCDGGGAPQIRLRDDGGDERAMLAGGLFGRGGLSSRTRDGDVTHQGFAVKRRHSFDVSSIASAATRRGMQGQDTARAAAGTGADSNTRASPPRPDSQPWATLPPPTLLPAMSPVTPPATTDVVSPATAAVVPPSILGVVAPTISQAARPPPLASSISSSPAAHEGVRVFFPPLELPTPASPASPRLLVNP